MRHCKCTGHISRPHIVNTGTISQIRQFCEREAWMGAVCRFGNNHGSILLCICRTRHRCSRRCDTDPAPSHRFVVPGLAQRSAHPNIRTSRPILCWDGLPESRWPGVRGPAPGSKKPIRRAGFSPPNPLKAQTFPNTKKTRSDRPWVKAVALSSIRPFPAPPPGPRIATKPKTAAPPIRPLACDFNRSQAASVNKQ